MLARKQSDRSEDSDQFPTTITQVEKLTISSGVTAEPGFRRSSYMLRQETNSTESKDTLTPQDGSDEPTLVDDGSVEYITDLNFDAMRQKALRRRSSCRRNSETCDLNRSQNSLNAAGLMMKRQRSLTQSEPDSGNEQC